jgi:hypothetical protein
MSIGQGQESYGMREMQHHGNVQPGELFDPYAAAGVGAAAAGAAGIGVARARSHRALQDDATGAGGSYGAGLQEGGAPYAAFAAPSHPPMPAQQQEYGGRNPNLDVMEAAGLGAHVAGAGALARSQSKSAASAVQQDQYGLERNKSLGSYDAYAAYPQAVQSSQQHQQQQSSQQQHQQHQQHQQQSYYSSSTSVSPPPPSGAQAQMYGGYTQQQQSHQQSSYQQSSSFQHTSSYQTQHHQSYQTQQQTHQRGYSDVGADEDDAYGGYVVEEEPHGAASSGPATGSSRGAEALPNPFERPVASSHGHSYGHGQGGHAGGAGGYADYDERDRASSDDGDTDAEPPRRVLKVANE